MSIDRLSLLEWLPNPEHDKQVLRTGGLQSVLARRWDFLARSHLDYSISFGSCY